MFIKLLPDSCNVVCNHPCLKSLRETIHEKVFLIFSLGNLKKVPNNKVIGNHSLKLS